MFESNWAYVTTMTILNKIKIKQSFGNSAMKEIKLVVGHNVNYCW
jgi:hypothetical protein